MYASNSMVVWDEMIYFEVDILLVYCMLRQGLHIFETFHGTQSNTGSLHEGH